jgi:hypothetical protein
MKSANVKIVAEATYALMEHEEREQGFQRHEFLAEVLIYTAAGKLDPDSRQLHAQIDDILDRECITVNCGEDGGWRYYGKGRASLENIGLAAKSRRDHGEAILNGASRNASMQYLVRDYVAQGMGYFEAESLIRKQFED